MKIDVDKDRYILDTAEDELKTLLMALDYFRDNAEGIDRERHFETASRLRESIIEALTLSAMIDGKPIEEPAIYITDSLNGLVENKKR